MANLKEYSGLTTKIRAMRGQLIKKEEYIKLAELSTISEFVEHLKKYKGYQDIFEGVNTEQIHRGTLEKIMSYSVYKDFSKIYKFSNINQRKFLKLYFIKYEISVIKRAIRSVGTGEKFTGTDKAYDIFCNYSDIDISSINSAKTIDGIIEKLKGTIYYESLVLVSGYTQKSIFDYEMALDVFYFSYFWKKRRSFKGSELKNIINFIGTEIDSLNVLWIYRAKKYYRLSPAQIYSMIIPVNYKLKKEMIISLVESQEMTDFNAELEKIPFLNKMGKEKEAGGLQNLEESYTRLVKRLNHKFFTMDPYSLACINVYLYDKNEEIVKLIKIAESIRYGYKADIIRAEII